MNSQIDHQSSRKRYACRARICSDQNQALRVRKLKNTVMIETNENNIVTSLLDS